MKKKKVVYKEVYMEGAMVTPLESYIKNKIEDSVYYGSGCLEGATQKLEETSNMLIRLMKTLIDKNILTESEIYYIIHGREIAFLDEEESFHVIEE